MPSSKSPKVWLGNKSVSLAQIHPHTSPAPMEVAGAERPEVDRILDCVSQAQAGAMAFGFQGAGSVSLGLRPSEFRGRHKVSLRRGSMPGVCQTTAFAAQMLPFLCVCIDAHVPEAQVRRGFARGVVVPT